MFGLLVIDKPGDMTSRRVVDLLQARSGCSQIGHAGTLDPMAKGVLLLAIGNATRLVEYLHELSKVYFAEFEFGKTSDTLDCEGEIQILPNSTEFTREEIDRECQRWTGRVEQIPPKYSAIHVQGRRAYELARAGEDFELAPRTVNIDRIEVVDYSYPRLQLRIHCGSGTYIRSLGRDVAVGLGTGAIMTGLVRQSIGPFTLQNAMQLSGLQNRQDVLDNLINPVHGLVNWRKVELSPEIAVRVGHGQTICLSEIDENCERMAAVDATGQLLGLLQRTGADQWKPFRVFHVSKATNQPTTKSASHNPES